MKYLKDLQGGYGAIPAIEYFYVDDGGTLVAYMGYRQIKLKSFSNREEAQKYLDELIGELEASDGEQSYSTFLDNVAEQFEAALAKVKGKGGLKQ